MPARKNIRAARAPRKIRFLKSILRKSRLDRRAVERAVREVALEKKQPQDAQSL